ncbi:MAG: hypothetical protein AABX07_03870 [Nanoarchaeota archaeon]
MNKKVIGVIIIVVVALALLIVLKMNKPLKYNEVKILTPVNGAELEIGNNYTITWTGSYNKELVHLAFMEKGKSEPIYIIGRNLPFASKSYTFSVRYLDDYKGKEYQIVMWDENISPSAKVIGESNGFFTLKDDDYNISGSETIRINSSNIFNFGIPFTIKGIAGHEVSNQTSYAIYSSSQNIKPGLVTARIVSFHNDACEVLTYPDSGGICDVQGEQAVRIFVRAIINDGNLFYVIGRNIYLTSNTIKEQKFGDADFQYEVDLISFDIQKEEATITIRKT